jgi:hypothetical protein
MEVFMGQWALWDSLTPTAAQENEKNIQNSATGTRARVARVRVEYPIQLDYSGAEHTQKQNTP